MTNILIIKRKEAAEWKSLEAYLKRKKCPLWRASRAGDAIRMLKHEPIMIVLLDYDIAGIGGLRLLRRIKEVRQSVEVICLSEKAGITTAIAAMKEGAYDFYEFPVNKRLLMAVIHKAVEKQTLNVEKMELERRITDRFRLDSIIGKSKAILHVIDLVKSVAPKQVNVLLLGPTGTGKELTASAIHYNSHRASGPFVKLNCAAFNEGVLESELFGHEKGAFTGAVAARVGRFEQAGGGTIFLDEIGDIPLTTQIRLLRVIQEGQIERVGGNSTIIVDVRVIAATHRDLKALMAEGRFREDLYYRLNVVTIDMPSLADRMEDIPLLVSHFIRKLNESKDYGFKGITREAMQVLMSYHWPGNVRELENALESAMAVTDRDVIEARYLPSFLLHPREGNGDFHHLRKGLTLREMEDELIHLTLADTCGNKTAAARLLGMGLRTLQRKTKQA